MFNYVTVGSWTVFLMLFTAATKQMGFIPSVSSITVNKTPFAVWIEFMMGLTSGLRALAHLKLHASEQLSGDQTVGYNHHHSRDEEQSKQQQHIPEKQPE